MRVVRVLLAPLMLIAPAPGIAQERDSLADGTVLEARPYHMPFASVDAWVKDLKQRYPELSLERQTAMRRRFAPTFEILRRSRVTITRVVYASDGHRVVAYLVRPRSVKGERHPAVIYNRGGNRDFGALVLWDFLDFTDLASQGYVVIASQYRGTDGGDGVEEFGGADVDDVLNLIPLLAARADVDSTRIGMMGWSRGGMMTYLALTRTDRIVAAIVGSGLADLFDTIKRRPDMETEVIAELVPGYPATKDSALRARSAVFWPERLNKQTPILVLQGSADWRVDASQALHLAEGLYSTKHPFRFVLFEGGDHGLTEYQGQVDTLVKTWLDRYVRDRKPWPSLDPHGF